MDYKLATGAHESPKDNRDWTLASAGVPEIYPDDCMLDTSWMIPSMQGHIGCCVGCTFEEIVRQIIYLTNGTKSNPGTDQELSWRFVYAIAKCQDGYQDEGTYPNLVAKIIRTYGVPLAKYCPNDISLDHETFVYHRKIENIPIEAFSNALYRKSGADLTVPLTEQGIKQAINYAKQNKGGVAILRQIGDCYWTDDKGNGTWDKAKLLPIRTPKTIVGGHEELLTGYSKEATTGRTKIHWLNHWSKDWADNGRGWEYLDIWLPYIKEIRVSVASIPTNEDFKYHFTKRMVRGDQGPDVVALQHVLKLEGYFPAEQPFTGYFGAITMAAVMAIQNKYANEILKPLGLTNATGVVGTSTLTWLNKHYGI